MNPIPRILILALFLLLLAAPARAAGFSDDSRAFSFQFPKDDGWVPLSPDEISDTLKNFSDDLPKKPFAGFQLADIGTLLIFTGPYADGQLPASVPLATIQQIAATYSGIHRTEFKSAEVPALPPGADSGAKPAPVAPPALAAGAANQLATFTNPPGFVVDYRDLKSLTRTRTYVFLGRNHYVALHFLMRPASHADLRPSFESIAASFRFHSSQATFLKKTGREPGDYTAFGTYLFVTLVLITAGVIAYYLLKKRPY